MQGDATEEAGSGVEGRPPGLVLAVGGAAPPDPQPLGGPRTDEFPIRQCHTVAELITALRATRPALVLLNDDGRLPGPLATLLAVIKAATDVPCVLRALRADEEADRIAALDGGCDDWISHGVSEREAFARLRAVLRRTARPRPSSPLPAAKPPPAWRLSPERRELYGPDGQAVGLTSAEFDLLHTMMQHRGAVVSREVLSRAVFRRTWYPRDRGIDNLAARLRRKLSARSRNPQVVKAVRGVGYAFTGL